MPQRHISAPASLTAPQLQDHLAAVLKMPRPKLLRERLEASASFITLVFCKLYPIVCLCVTIRVFLVPAAELCQVAFPQHLFRSGHERAAGIATGSSSDGLRLQAHLSFSSRFADLVQSEHSLHALKETGVLAVLNRHLSTFWSYPRYCQVLNNQKSCRPRSSRSLLHHFRRSPHNSEGNARRCASVLLVFLGNLFLQH